MVHLLLDRPERYALLRDEPARVPAAVEKLLRYAQAAMGAHLRVAVEDVTLSGVTIGAERPGCRAHGLRTSRRGRLPPP
ncbi:MULTISPECIES: hypothetical protein [unclassified Streptomyces]|uniref:hypothetical protein n=1 Tax=unclassified Streptomyces TaxID=2593676 RepID=UPI0037F1A7D0